MAVTLPTFADVGIADPRSVGSLPTYPANDAVAEGTAALGAGIAKAGGTIEDVAAYNLMAKNRMDRAMADADFTGRIIPLTEQLKKETDPEKITALRGQFQTALETSGNAIADPTARKLWQAQQSKHVAVGQAEADLRNTDVYRDRYKAGVISQLDSLSRTGASASDPAAFDLSQSNIGNVTQSALASGAMTAVEATTYNKAATKQLVDGRARYLANNGDPEGARAFLAAHTGDLDAITLQSLEAHIETKGDQTVALRAVNQALGRSPAPGGALPAPSGGHINYGATGALGDPTQPGWEQQNLTNVSAPGGASFKVNKAAAADFAGFLKDLEATGYKINPGESGGHNLREITGGNQLSEHAYGTAIDINSSKNPYSKSGEKVTDLPANVAELAAKHNLEWGGNWTSPVDTMHFQWRGPGGGQVVAADTGAPDRVDNWETRNNNFGGIRKSGVNATTAEGGFQSFPTPEAGVQAIANNLDRYAAGGVVTATNPDGKPLNTIRGIVSTWAPPNENKTDELIARASQVTGFDPDQQLNVSDPAVKAKLIEATIRNEQGGKLPVSPAVIAKVAGGALPGQGVLTRGQATLAALPDYLTARSSIMSNPSLNDRQRKLALDGLTSQFHQETTLYNAFDANAKRDLSDRQSANGAELLARGIAGEVVDPTQLADWVRTQQITPEAFKTYQTELARQGKGTDDLSVFNDIDRRARAGEDVNNDIQQAVGAGKLKGTTGLALQRAADAREQREGDQVERANFSTLRTLAGGDAVEKGLVSFGNEDHVRQIQLWTQAQREWNQRVLIDKEDSNAVLADMAPRYGHPVTDPKALPRPRMGAIEKPEDLPAVAQKTQAAHDAGAISEQQYREEQDLIVRYKAILDEQQQRAAAAAAAKAAAPAGSNAARGRVEMK